MTVALSVWGVTLQRFGTKTLKQSSGITQPPNHLSTLRFLTPTPVLKSQLHTSLRMGKQKHKNTAYNEYLDGERLSDNSHVRSTLQESISQPSLSNAKPPPGPPSENNNKKKQPLTHFLSLPLVTLHSLPQLQTSLAHLRTTVARTDIPEKAVRPASSLHLTLGVMALTPSSLAAVLQHLSSLDLAALLASVTPEAPLSENPTRQMATNGITVQLKGLKPMPGRGLGTSVLYAEAIEDDHGEARLVQWGEAVRREFSAWMPEGERERGLRVHCTVLNTVYARGRGRGEKQGGGRKGPMKFDPKELSEAYGDFVWAEGVRIDRVQVCEMGARKVRDGRGEVVDEVYEVVGERMVG